MNPGAILQPRLQAGLGRLRPYGRAPKRWRSLGGLALALALGLALTACGDGDDESGAADDATPTATAPAAGTATATQPASTPTEGAAEDAEDLTLQVAEDDALGTFLVDADGRTLYAFTRDEPGRSNCADTCLDNWPPLTVQEGASVSVQGDAPGEFDVFEHPDGTRQVTYNGAPLYYWAADAQAGQAGGHRVGGVWFVARPDTASTAVVNIREEGNLAPYLVGPDGMTLYLFTNDEPGVSNCTGTCAENWPPLTVPEGLEPTAVEDAPGELGVIERADGLGRQVTYDGVPLYYWAADARPGDTSGHEVGSVWFVVPPEGEAGISGASGGSGGASANDDRAPDY